MRPFSIVLVLAISACASSGSKPESDIARPMDRIVASDPQGVIRTTVDPNAKTTIEFPVARVLTVIKSVYEELGLPSPTVDAASGKVTAPRFDKIRKLGNVNLSMYFNCGDSLNGNIANTYRIYIDVVSVVRPDGKGGSVLETAVNGSAADMGGSSSGRVPCGTTGRIEERIQNGVRQKATAASP